MISAQARHAVPGQLIYRTVAKTVAPPLVSASEMEMCQVNASAVQLFPQVSCSLSAGLFAVPEDLATDDFEEFLGQLAIVPVTGNQQQLEVPAQATKQLPHQHLR